MGRERMYERKQDHEGCHPDSVAVHFARAETGKASWLTWLRRIGLSLLILALTLFSLGVTYQLVATEIGWRNHPALGQMVDAGLLLVGADPVVGGALHSPLGWVVLLAAIGVLVAMGRLPSPRSEETHGDAE
jgi:hypothetical protein